MKTLLLLSFFLLGACTSNHNAKNQKISFNIELKDNTPQENNSSKSIHIKSHYAANAGEKIVMGGPTNSKSKEFYSVIAIRSDQKLTFQIFKNDNPAGLIKVLDKAGERAQLTSDSISVEVERL